MSRVSPHRCAQVAPVVRCCVSRATALCGPTTSRRPCALRYRRPLDRSRSRRGDSGNGATCVVRCDPKRGACFGRDDHQDCSRHVASRPCPRLPVSPRACFSLSLAPHARTHTHTESILTVASVWTSPAPGPTCRRSRVDRRPRPLASPLCPLLCAGTPRVAFYLAAPNTSSRTPQRRAVCSRSGAMPTRALV